ncbi:uncharacterized protein LOC132696886 [Cylas formicarius]|uniref:uncharacterized protein LOC132696886 n=1 Tax=Cylas formicarius TaxID=197179 RepID=UPI00295880CB|nr:uncharacterized protein LOC132696886 [Cylas formicarius]
MKSAIILVGLVCYAKLSFAEEVRLLDLEPTDAQQVIESQDQTLKYAPKIDSNVPAVRFLGNEPHHVAEDIYLARQYHGQDGLGGYLYGYSVPDIAKNEKKKAGGDLRGAYNYIAGDGQEIRVEYWDDGTGFHQIDNVPKILPKQIDDSPEVKAAKEEFLKRWNEEAERNQHPVANPYNSEGQYSSGPLSAQGQLERQKLFNQQPQQLSFGYQKDFGQSSPGFSSQSQHQAQYSADSSSQPSGTSAQSQQFSSGLYRAQGVAGPSQSVSQPSQFGGSSQAQFGGQYRGPGNPGAQGYSKYNPAPENQVDYSGQYSENRDIYAKANSDEDSEENTTGPPKGFFYSFDYPVGIIVQKGAALKREAGVRDVYEENKSKFESQLAQRQGNGGSSSTGYVYLKN